MSHSPKAPLSSGSRKKLRKVLPIPVLPSQSHPRLGPTPLTSLRLVTGPSALSWGQALPCPVRDQPRAPQQAGAKGTDSGGRSLDSSPSPSWTLFGDGLCEQDRCLPVLGQRGGAGGRPGEQRFSALSRSLARFSWLRAC